MDQEGRCEGRQIWKRNSRRGELSMLHPAIMLSIQRSGPASGKVQGNGEKRPRVIPLWRYPCGKVKLGELRVPYHSEKL
jgi:hypothetical protein